MNFYSKLIINKVTAKLSEDIELTFGEEIENIEMIDCLYKEPLKNKRIALSSDELGFRITLEGVKDLEIKTNKGTYVFNKRTGESALK